MSGWHSEPEQSANFWAVVTILTISLVCAMLLVGLFLGVASL